MRIVGCLLVLVGLSVFAIRLQHAGPYAFPGGGNLLASVLALLVGGWLARARRGGRRLEGALRWGLLATSPIIFFFALYATLAELEEVVVLKTTSRAGDPVDLRLWIVDDGDGVAWVTMPRSKADAHRLHDARVELVRHGEVRCVATTRHSDQATLDATRALRQTKYAVQRLATRLGMFSESSGTQRVALRLDPCPAP